LDQYPEFVQFRTPKEMDEKTRPVVEAARATPQ
jgi:hypothetical protein